VLSKDERERASRLLLPGDGSRFTCARALLRRLLASRTGVPAGEIEFRYGPKGKPYLAGPAANGDLRFNLSHSHGMALFALAYGRDLGADLEKVRPVRRGERVARRFFADEEQDALHGLSGPSWQAAFFRCWTRKEAFIKLLGEGLARPLRSFAVTVREGEAPRVLRVDGDDATLHRAHLIDLAAPAGFVAALAVLGTLGPVARLDVDAGGRG
jgi:4'-phosphopantetheinyl transferase